MVRHAVPARRGHTRGKGGGVKGNRYTINVVTEARRLYADGWKPKEICGMLEAQFGVKPRLTTVCVWVKPDQAERARRHQAYWNGVRSTRRAGRLGHPKARPELRDTRRRVLGELGLTPAMVDAVMAFDFEGVTTPAAPPPSRAMGWGTDLMLRLREEGLPYTAIAAVGRVVFGVEVTPHMARYKLQRAGVPRSERKAENARRQWEAKRERRAA